MFKLSKPWLYLTGTGSATSPIIHIACYAFVATLLELVSMTL